MTGSGGFAGLPFSWKRQTCSGAVFFFIRRLSASWAPSVIPFSRATFLPPASRAVLLLAWKVVLDEDEVSSGSFKRRGRSLKLEVLYPHLSAAAGRTRPLLAALHHPSTRITAQISLIHRLTIENVPSCSVPLRALRLRMARSPSWACASSSCRRRLPRPLTSPPSVPAEPHHKQGLQRCGKASFFPDRLVLVGSSVPPVPIRTGA